MKKDKFHHVLEDQESREQQPRFNAETEAAIQEARDIISGKVPAKHYDSARALLADLDND